MKAMCAFFGVSRAAYYAWLKRLEQPDKDTERMAMVQETWEKSRKTYGYRRINLWLRQHKEVVINHKAVLRLMNKLNIRSVARKRKPFTKMSRLNIYHRYDNLLDRQFTAEKPNQKWVTDITYIRTTQGWAYLAAIKDLYDGFIVAHKNLAANFQFYWSQTLSKWPIAKKKSLMEPYSTVTRDINTRHTRILSLPKSITLSLPCPAVAIVGITHPWRISSDISKRKLYGNLISSLLTKPRT